MIQPEDLAIGASADLNSRGHLVRLSREAQDLWRVARFPDSWPSGLASGIITRVPDDARPWIVEPADTAQVPEDFVTWSTALDFAANLEAPLP